MKFKTELHCHSRTVSQCASITPQEIVEKYLERGYTTVVLADHLSPSTFEGKRYQGSNNWQEQIDYYMNGYHALRDAAAGKRRGDRFRPASLAGRSSAPRNALTQVLTRL